MIRHVTGVACAVILGATLVASEPALGETSFQADAASDAILRGAVANHSGCTFAAYAYGRPRSACRVSGENLIYQAARARARFLPTTTPARPTALCAEYRRITLDAYAFAGDFGRRRNQAAFDAHARYIDAERIAESLERRCRR